jgi:hypothetical protein
VIEDSTLGAQTLRAIVFAKSKRPSPFTSSPIIDIIARTPMPRIAGAGLPITSGLILYPGGPFAEKVLVTIGEVQDCSNCVRHQLGIHFTTDGEDPSKESEIYMHPFTIDTPGTTVVKAIMTHTGQTDSVVAGVSFKVLKRVDTRTSDIVSGEFVDTVKVHLSCETEGVRIRYTTNGDTSNVAFAEYMDGNTLRLHSKGSEARYTIKAMGILVPQMADGLVMVSGSILVQPQVPPPNFGTDPNVGPFVDKVLVTLSDIGVHGARILYTVDGSNPMTSRSRLMYYQPFLLSTIFPGKNTASTVVVRHGMAPSEVKTFNYVIKHQVCTPVFSRLEGCYIIGVPITIDCAGGKAADVYVTITNVARENVTENDSDMKNESNSFLYSETFQLADIGNTTIAAIAVGKDLISSDVTISPQYVVEPERVCEAGEYEPGTGSDR